MLPTLTPSFHSFWPTASFFWCPRSIVSSVRYWGQRVVWRSLTLSLPCIIILNWRYIYLLAFFKRIGRNIIITQIAIYKDNNYHSSNAWIVIVNYRLIFVSKLAEKVLAISTHKCPRSKHSIFCPLSWLVAVTTWELMWRGDIATKRT